MIETIARVVEIEKSANGQVVFVYFEVGDDVSFQEGQFMFLERLDFQYPDGKAMKNAYSIGTINKVLKEKGIVGTIVKKSSEGGMSDYLTNTIKIGDEIKIKMPLGHFVNKNLSNNYLFVSIGSGITPVYAHYNNLLQTGNYNKIVNIFGERSSDFLLDSVVEKYSINDDRIKNLLYLSKEENLSDRWNRGYVQQGLESAFEFFGDCVFQTFLCGKPVMVDDVVSILLDMGIDRDFINFEKY